MRRWCEQWATNVREEKLLILVRFPAGLLLIVAILSGAARADEDPRDSAVVGPLVKQTLEFERTGKDLKWSNPETGSRGIIRVERTYYRDANTPCRDYIRTTKRPDGEDTTMRGTGCRMGDGQWYLNEAVGAPPPKVPPATARAATGATDAKAAAAPSAAPKTKTPAIPAPAGMTAEGSGPDEPDEDEMAEVGAPTPPRVKPKVLAPDFTMPSKSAL